MNRSLIIFVTPLIVASVLVALAARINSVLIGFKIQTEEKHLATLEDRREELRAKYLRTALEQIAPAAQNAGFVAVHGPSYVRRDSLDSTVASAR